MTIQEKLDLLRNNLQKLDGLIVAFSGGVDSTFLLSVAKEVLGDRVTAITARSSTYPEREYLESVKYAAQMGVNHVIIESEELDVEGFSQNPINRCYLCKNELYTKIKSFAYSLGVNHIADGSNLDDINDYRPGMIATKEQGVLSPLKEAYFTKEDIRILSKASNLPTWDKPAFACLSSRFPYGQQITREALNRVDQAEQFLMDLGLRQVRVRDYGDLARIEVNPAERKFFFDERIMDEVHDAFVGFGYRYITLDLKGYRTGSMNESLELK